MEMQFEHTPNIKSIDLIFGFKSMSAKLIEKFWTALLDSGASAHMFGHIRFFVPGSLKPCYKRIECADGMFLYAYWQGTVLLVRNPEAYPTDPTCMVICNDSLLVEGISKSLVSVSKLTDDGYSVECVDNLAIIRSKSDNKKRRKIVYTLTKAVNKDRLYHFPFISANDVAIKSEKDTTTHSSMSARTTTVTKQIMHERYNHCNEKYIDIIDPRFIKEKLPFCNACALNLKSAPYKKKTYYPKINNLKTTTQTKVTDPSEMMEKALETAINYSSSIAKGEVIEELAYLRSEVQPRMKLTPNDKPFTAVALDAKTSPITSIRGFKYAFVLVCLITRFTYSFLVSNKDMITEEYVSWAKEMYNRTGRFPAIIRLDLAGEHTSVVLITFFKNCGTKVTYSDTGASNENSYVERKIGVLWIQTKILLTNSGVPFIYWCYAFSYATCIGNHIPHRGLGNKKPVDVAEMISIDAMIRIFGSAGWFYKKTKTKNELTGVPGIHLGFAEKIRGYWFLNLETKKVDHARTCVTNEEVKPLLLAATSMGLPIHIVKWPERSKEGGPPILPIGYPSISQPETKVKTKNDPSFPFAFTPEALVTKDGPEIGPLQLHKGIPKEIPLTVTNVFNPTKPLIRKPNYSVNNFNPTPPINSSKNKTNLFLPLSSIPNKSRMRKPAIDYPQTIQENSNDSHHSASNDREEEKFEVEKIIGHRRQRFGPVADRNGFDFLVQWKNGDKTYEPRSNLNDCRTSILQYCEPLGIDPGSMTPTRNLDYELTNVDFNTNRSLENLHHQEPNDNLIDQSKIDLINNPFLDLLKQNTTTESITTNEGEIIDKISIEVPLNFNPSLQANSTEIKIGLNQLENQQYWDSLGNLRAYSAAQKIDPPPDYSEHILYVREDPDDCAEHINMALPVIIEILGDNGSREAPPKTTEEMLDGPRREEFIEGELRELGGIGKHGTAVVVPRPNDRKPITCRWVYDIKRNEQNEITLFKARLVAHGFKQIHGVDYDKTFSSTAQMRSFRMTVMLACAFGLDIVQWDISNAFLNGTLEEEIYMEYPPGYQGPLNTCLQLLKGLYGLKQASRIWNRRLVEELKKAGLRVCKTEPGIMYHPTKRCFICLHVDDILAATSDKQLRDSIFKTLASAFLIKDLGELHQYVGVNVVRTPRTIDLDQSAYLERVLQKFLHWLETKQAKNPNFPDKLSKLDLPVTEEEWEELKKFPYPNIVGSLMYAAVATRPDIIQPVITLSRYMSRWGEKQIKAAELVLKFLRGTYKDGIRYTVPLNFNGVLNIYVFSDSDWAGCVDTRRSTVGFIIYMCGGPIAWKSQMKKTIALSSCEAEYMALSEAGREIIWIINFLTEIGVKFNRPRIYCDSSSAINWAEDPIEHKRNKHIEMQYYYIRDIVAAEKVDIYKVSSLNNSSDPLTKNVVTPIYQRLRPSMMGWEIFSP